MKIKPAKRFLVQLTQLQEIVLEMMEKNAYQVAASSLIVSWTLASFVSRNSSVAASSKSRLCSVHATRQAAVTPLAPFRPEGARLERNKLSSIGILLFSATWSEIMQKHFRI